jgi:hypothetical protein
MGKIGKESRAATLYVRVQPSSKMLVAQMAKKLGVSEAVVINSILQNVTPDQVAKMVKGR